ncbi:hypothetical protein [Piscirickettsia litoralis]|uniref:F5/8 type C domain-containing protein n=1 Tax=Piscirickettsia litoralis TaxID=1891921 RepID=A0ABX3A5A8_9GAMM|nr:hypothetical protein [Piscirickettsia litoralis]ODN41294.1 hypothetical protein BGC07_17170 [Piscirickettsia litoralis]
MSKLRLATLSLLALFIYAVTAHSANSCNFSNDLFHQPSDNSCGPRQALLASRVLEGDNSFKGNILSTWKSLARIHKVNYPTTPMPTFPDCYLGDGTFAGPLTMVSSLVGYITSYDKNIKVKKIYIKKNQEDALRRYFGNTRVNEEFNLVENRYHVPVIRLESTDEMSKLVKDNHYYITLEYNSLHYIGITPNNIYNSSDAGPTPYNLGTVDSAGLMVELVRKHTRSYSAVLPNEANSSNFHGFEFKVTPGITASGYHSYNAVGPSSFEPDGTDNLGSYKATKVADTWALSKSYNDINTTIYWQVKLPTPKALWLVEIGRRGDSSKSGSSGGKYFYAFDFQGSNDGENWKTLSRDYGGLYLSGLYSDIEGSDRRSDRLRIFLNDPTFSTYRYYRFVVRATVGDTPGMANVQFYAYEDDSL